MTKPQAFSDPLLPDPLLPDPLLVDDVRTGSARPLGPDGALSAIVKEPVGGPVLITTLGLVGDEQADLRVHGGPDKAVHHYDAGHYPFWRERFPAIADALYPGSMGENIVTRGVSESGICLGDRLRLGAALVEVSQPRQPCWKINARFQHQGVSEAVQETGKSGWYYRVLQEGMLAPGDRIRLEARPHPDWTVERLSAVALGRGLDPEEMRAQLAVLVEMDALAEPWRAMARKRLDRLSRRSDEA